jgi:hypothetical protein
VITNNLDVPAGTMCALSGNEVMGTVTVEGSLTVWGGHFDKNVSVTGGAFAGINNPVQIDGQLSFLNPAAYSYNGFWVNGLVKGNVTYKIDNTMAYPDYQSPLLYFGGGTQVVGNFSYSDQGIGFAGHLDTHGLTAKNFPTS